METNLAESAARAADATNLLPEAAPPTSGMTKRELRHAQWEGFKRRMGPSAALWGMKATWCCVCISRPARRQWAYIGVCEVCEQRKK